MSRILSKSLFLLLLVIALLLDVGCTKKAKNKISHKAGLSSEAFADSVLKELSIKSKVALLHGMGGGNSEFGDMDVRFFGIKGNNTAGIPPLYMGHGITGVRSGRDTTIHATYFTTPIAIGCSWDTLLYRRVSKAIAKEMRALGQDLSLGPTLNIIRHPLGGRNWESFSEDPFLTSKMGIAYVEELQSNGIIAGPKHFVANNQETNRFDINNEVDERTLREIYLPAFKAAVMKGGALNIMGAYNRVNGTYMCHNKYLLDDVLRGEWGFQGFTISDFANGIKNTEKAINARMDVEMHRPKYYGDSLLAKVRNGSISEAKIDTLVKDVLRVMHRMKLFERKRYKNQEIVHQQEHIDLAKEVTTKSVVLLKNKEAFLPLKQEKFSSVAIIGPNAKRFRSVGNEHMNYSYYLQGGGSGRTYYFHNAVIDPYSGLKNRLGTKIKIAYAQGCATPDLFQGEKLPKEEDDLQLIAEAVALAKNSEAAVIYVGLSGFNESEGRDRPAFALPGRQNQLIKEVAKVNPNTVVVLISGSSVDVTPWIDDVKSVLFAPYSGEQIGNGIADILMGAINPSGKLPFSWPKNIGDYPQNSLFLGKPYSKDGKSNIYSEGLFVGYRWFDKEHISTQFPFGHGLSYTFFNYQKLEMPILNGWPKDIKVTIENTGSLEGEEIIQLYVKDVESSLPRPEKELKSFSKIKLAPGESKEVVFSLEKDAFSYYSVEKRKWMLENGAFEIQIGPNAEHIALAKRMTINQ